MSDPFISLSLGDRSEEAVESALRELIRSNSISLDKPYLQEVIRSHLIQRLSDYYSSDANVSFISNLYWISRMHINNINSLTESEVREAFNMCLKQYIDKIKESIPFEKLRSEDFMNHKLAFRSHIGNLMVHFKEFIRLPARTDAVRRDTVDSLNLFCLFPLNDEELLKVLNSIL